MIHCALRLDARQQLQLGQDYSSRLEEVAIEQEAQRQCDKICAQPQAANTRASK